MEGHFRCSILKIIFWTFNLQVLQASISTSGTIQTGLTLSGSTVTQESSRTIFTTSIAKSSKVLGPTQNPSTVSKTIIPTTQQPSSTTAFTNPSPRTVKTAIPELSTIKSKPEELSTTGGHSTQQTTEEEIQITTEAPPLDIPILFIAAGCGALVTILVAVPIIVIVTRKCCGTPTNIQKYEFDYEAQEMRPVLPSRAPVKENGGNIYSSTKKRNATASKPSDIIYDVPRKQSLSNAQGLYMVSPMTDYGVPPSTFGQQNGYDSNYSPTDDTFPTDKCLDEPIPLSRNSRKDSEISYNAIYSTHNTFTTEL